MRISNFTLLLILAILMVIGLTLLPKIDIADKPTTRQGKTLTVKYSWPQTSAKVVEQNVTSKIEGLVSSVKGVKSVSSESSFGSGKVIINLKQGIDVSSVKFEISSLLRRTYKQMPKGVTYPVLTGGEDVSEEKQNETSKLLLTYQVNSNFGDEQLKEFIKQKVEPTLKRIDDVKRVEVTGGINKYIEITYDPFTIANYGLTAYDIEKGIRSFIGHEDMVGEVIYNGKRIDLILTTDGLKKPLEQIPIGIVGDKTIYLNDLASYEYKNREPKRYFRVNGLNTIYLNIYADAEANKIALSDKLQRKMKDMERQFKKDVFLTLTYNSAQERENELHKLVWRSLMSLAILLFFVWLAKREWKYLFIMMTTLAAIILIAIIFYWFFDIRLHIYSLAGITVSLGLVIDASIVMTDHYSYYHNRKAFLAILAALLTTIGSLVIVFWLPEFIRKDLNDFSCIIIVNLSVALLVAYVFTPALIEQIKYESYQRGRIRHKTLVTKWTHFYSRYVAFSQQHKWIYVVLLIMAFGIPFHALPQRWEGQEWYNRTLGSDFFQLKCKDSLAKIFGGTMRLFAESLSKNISADEKEEEKYLTIKAQMPLGGNVSELNDKIIILENFLARFNEIKRFETSVEAWGATINVEFKKAYQYTSFPYLLENKVIGKIISIGGAEWSTSGVSERGFCNSLNLQHRSSCIEISGYNYDRLYRIAEDLRETLKKNSRVVDLIIETPGHENQQDELYIKYNKERMALYDINSTHQALKEILSGYDIDLQKDDNTRDKMYLKSSAKDKFDLWHLQNSYVKINGTDVKFSNFMDIERHASDNYIPKKNQEYVLRVAFNVLGTYAYTNKYIERVTQETNANMPVGYRCLNASNGYHEDTDVQYWLILLIVIIIFFVCSILFESLRLPLVIISLIPVSFIGAFLTYYLLGVEFGIGGFASLVLLSGLTVNGGIYIINEYKQTMTCSKVNDTDKALRMYVRAYNHKITAVLLTILSTVIGLIPFFVDGKEEKFWFSFAIGSIGGLLFSIIAIVLVMPIFMELKRKPRLGN